MSESTPLCSETVLQGLLATVADADGAIAMSQLDMALARWPTDARLHFLRASLLAEAQRFDEAVTAFAAALAHDPELHIARFQLGLLLLSSNHTEAALRVWAPLDALDPTAAQIGPGVGNSGTKLKARINGVNVKMGGR